MMVYGSDFTLLFVMLAAIERGVSIIAKTIGVLVSKALAVDSFMVMDGVGDMVKGFWILFSMHLENYDK